MGREFVVSSMAGEEGYVCAAMLDNGYWRGWVAPWGERIDCCDRCIAVELLETGAADYCN